MDINQRCSIYDNFIFRTDDNLTLLKTLIVMMYELSAEANKLTFVSDKNKFYDSIAEFIVSCELYCRYSFKTPARDIIDYKKEFLKSESKISAPSKDCSIARVNDNVLFLLDGLNCHYKHSTACITSYKHTVMCEDSFDMVLCNMYLTLHDLSEGFIGEFDIETLIDFVDKKAHSLEVKLFS